MRLIAVEHMEEILDYTIQVTQVIAFYSLPEDSLVEKDSLT